MYFSLQLSAGTACQQSQGERETEERKRAREIERHNRLRESTNWQCVETHGGMQSWNWNWYWNWTFSLSRKMRRWQQHMSEWEGRREGESKRNDKWASERITSERVSRTKTVRIKEAACVGTSKKCKGNGIYSKKTDGAVVSKDSSAAHHFPQPHKSAA